MDEIRQLLSGLTDHELDYVLARSKSKNDAGAVRESGVAKSTFYSWPENRRAELGEIALRLKHSTVTRAMLILEKAAERAAGRIDELVDHRNPNVALRASQDVLDRTAGKPMQRQEVSGPGGGALNIVVKWGDNGDGDDDD